MSKDNTFSISSCVPQPRIYVGHVYALYRSLLIYRIVLHYVPASECLLNEGKNYTFTSTNMGIYVNTEGNMST
jgi:hypothetical protein